MNASFVMFQVHVYTVCFGEMLRRTLHKSTRMVISSWEHLTLIEERFGTFRLFPGLYSVVKRIGVYSGRRHCEVLGWTGVNFSKGEFIPESSEEGQVP